MPRASSVDWGDVCVCSCMYVCTREYAIADRDSGGVVSGAASSSCLATASNIGTTQSSNFAFISSTWSGQVREELHAF